MRALTFRGRDMRGLTLAEVIVAIGILSVVLVAVITLFTQLVSSTTKNNLLNLGTLYADRILEQSVKNARVGGPAFAPVTTGEESIVSHGDEAATRFAYRVEATRLSDPDPGEKWFLKIQVQWWHDNPDDPAQARAGYGKLSTTQGRLVYIK
jgi:type II secretory pathway pseudopilin PulG